MLKILYKDEFLDGGSVLIKTTEGDFMLDLALSTPDELQNKWYEVDETLDKLKLIEDEVLISTLFKLISPKVNFTVKEFNEHLKNFGQTLLKTAIDNHELIDVGSCEEDGWSENYILDGNSILNVFDEVFEQFKM